MPASADRSAAPEPRPPILTMPLVLFLLVVAGILGYSLWQRSIVPGPAEAIVLLGDGDLDGDERRRVLRALVVDGARSGELAERWAAMLAAVALEDRATFDASLAALGGPGKDLQVPPVGARDLLHLGDPLLGNILAALLAEAASDRGLAQRRWQQVQAQCRLMHRPLAAELAVAGLQRVS